MSSRTVRAPRGVDLNTCKSWHQEAALRCLMNNLDPDVAEKPDELIVTAAPARRRAQLGVVRCHRPRITVALRTTRRCWCSQANPSAYFALTNTRRECSIANSNLVGAWANWEHFHELERKGLMMYGQMTAGSWIYIGTQGIVQGTFETFAAMADKQFGGDSERKARRVWRHGRHGRRAAVGGDA